MLKQFTYKLAGSSSWLFLLLIFVFNLSALADEVRAPNNASDKIFTATSSIEKKNSIDLTWNDFEKMNLDKIQADKTDGISYIISGSLALLGGIAGTCVTTDPLEKGIYTLFQTIGIASVGYGAYKWQVGDDQRSLYNSLKNTREIDDSQRIAFLKVYYEDKKITESHEKYIKAMTHGLIAALNIYNASQQNQEGVKNTLYFIGGANLLAALSYSF